MGNNIGNNSPTTFDIRQDFTQLTTLIGDNSSNGGSSSTQTSLHWLFLQNPQPEQVKEVITKLYIKEGNHNNKLISASTLDLEGLTPLHYAAMYCKYPQSIQLLIDAGANVNAKSFRSDATPLHLACEGLEWPIVRVLLCNDASTNICNVDRCIPIECAKSSFLHQYSSSNDNITNKLIHIFGLFSSYGCQLYILGEYLHSRFPQGYDGDYQIRRRIKLFLINQEEEKIHHTHFPQNVQEFLIENGIW
jgi:hypothetical protein